MASLIFQIEGKKVVPFPTTLLIPCFKAIWERDKSPGKEYAIEDFSYIEFMTSLLKTNPYKGYDHKQREQILKRDIITRKGWVEDEMIKAGKAQCIEFQKNASPSYQLWLATMKAKRKLETFFNTFDMTATNEKSGLPVWKPKDITSAMLDVDKVTASLSVLERKVEEEVYDAVKTKGMKQVSDFANPDYFQTIIGTRD